MKRATLMKGAIDVAWAAAAGIIAAAYWTEGSGFFWPWLVVTVIAVVVVGLDALTIKWERETEQIKSETEQIKKRIALLHGVNNEEKNR